MSIEKLLNDYANGEDISNFKCKSRNETILKKKCLGDSCSDITPKSRMEYLLLNLQVGGSGGEAAVGTPVLNSGLIEKIYFNYNYDLYKAIDVFSKIQFITNADLFQLPFYVVYANADLSRVVLLYNGGVYDGTQTYGLSVVDFTTGQGLYDIYNSLNGTPIWEDDLKDIGYLELNQEAISESMGLPIGNQNDLLTELISITPFPVTDINITANGEYDVTDYKKAIVKVDDMLQARVDANNSCKHILYGYEGDNVDFVSRLDTSNVNSMESMFNSCSNVTTIPQLDTSKVTNMNYMFNNCSNLTSIPALDTSNVTTMNNMFSNCGVLTTIPQLDTSKVTNMNYMFYNCSSLTTIPQLYTSNVTTMNSMFSGCKVLTTIPQLDTSKISYMDSTFKSCTKLTNLTLLNIKLSLQIGSGTSWGHLLTLDSLINTVKELINVGYSRKLTMGTANLEKVASVYVKFVDSTQTTIPTNEKGEVVVCESTDDGAMTLETYANLKNWTFA